uniref:Uncharacterized protein n=1 Tax=Amphimedon queenslandica TaxID=400682 RepID=A0A1X7U821_AMPQE
PLIYLLIFLGMVWHVPLSCVRTLNGLHLLSFDPLSVKVSNLRINEMNRLRSKF